MHLQSTEYFFGYAEMSDVQMAPFKISATYVMPGCDDEVLFTVDRAYQQGVVRACVHAVRGSGRRRSSS